MEGTEFHVEISGTEMDFRTGTGVFSPSGADRGTKAMLSVVKPEKEDMLLDLGCGYGLVGIWAAKQIGADRVVMSDISETAVRIAKENCLRNGVDVPVYHSDGFQGIPKMRFTKILSNPPYHEDFSVPKAFIEQGFWHLETGGTLHMVTKRRDWYYNKLKAVFGGVKVQEIDGYFVFTARKCSDRKPEKKENQQIMSKKLQRRMQRRKHGSMKSAGAPARQ